MRGPGLGNGRTLIPRPPGCKILKGSDKWRIRIGNYRLIYEIDDSAKAVIVIKIAHRSNVYR